MAKNKTGLNRPVLFFASTRASEIHRLHPHFLQPLLCPVLQQGRFALQDSVQRGDGALVGDGCQGAGSLDARSLWPALQHLDQARYGG